MAMTVRSITSYASNGTRVKATVTRGTLGELLATVAPEEKVSHVYCSYAGVRVKLTSYYGNAAPAQIVAYKTPTMPHTSRTLYVILATGELDAVGFILPR